MKKIIFISIMTIALMMTSSPIYGQSLDGNLSIIGSNTVFPIIAEAQARWGEIHPDVQFATDGPGSGAGFDALLDGTADLAPMSRAPKASELQEASEVGQSIKQLTIARDALIVVLPPANPVTELTKDQVSGIFGGNITDWTEVDNSLDFSYMTDTTIRVVERDQDSGTHDFFNEFFLGGGGVPASELGANYAQYAGTGDLFSDVAENQNAIGYGGMAYLDNTIKAVSIDGVEANKVNAGDGTYSVTRPLFVVWDTNDEMNNPLIKEFTDYLMSPEGQYIADSVGYVAIEPMATGYTQVAAQDETPFNVLGLLLSFSILGLISKNRST